MSYENEPESARILTGPVIILVVLFIAFLLMTICALSFWFLDRQKEQSPIPQQDIPAVSVPADSLLNTMPTDDFSIHLPAIFSGRAPVSISVSEQIWKVTKIKPLGYASGSRRYDLATFRRADNQETAKGYCINPGWETPMIGTDYILTTEGTFVPLQESKADPFQRFLKIP
jgi:hypothetical protein